MSISPLQAQHILTLGLGFSASFYDAEKMQNFSNTYNFVNQNNLGSLMQGINGAEGCDSKLAIDLQADPIGER